MTRHPFMRVTSIIAGLLLAPALIPVALLATSTHAAAATTVPVKAAAAATKVSIVAGIHDTAINDCIQVLNKPRPKNETQQQVNQKARQEATASVRSGYWPSGVHNIRVTVPWDIADPSAPGTPRSSTDQKVLAATRTCFDDWLQGVYQAKNRLSPEIDFRADNNYTIKVKVKIKVRGKTRVKVMNEPRVPTMHQYRAAVTAFSNAYVTVKGRRVAVIAPWNEPDFYNVVFPDGHTHLNGKSCPAHPTETNCGAVMAAQMWAVTDGLIMDGKANGTKCTTCTIIAGDFSGRDGLGNISIKGNACSHPCKYVDLYSRHLITKGHHFKPTKWAVHPYSDIKGYQDGAISGAYPKVANFSARLHKDGYGKNTYIWLNEISTCATPDITSSCSDKHPENWRGQNTAMNYLLYTLPQRVAALDPRGPQVGRIDYYCFNGGRSACQNDWALIINSNTNHPSRTAAAKTFAAWARRRLSVHGVNAAFLSQAGAPRVHPYAGHPPVSLVPAMLKSSLGAAPAGAALAGGTAFATSFGLALAILSALRHKK